LMVRIRARAQRVFEPPRVFRRALHVSVASSTGVF
jgi:hypothetical protein